MCVYIYIRLFAVRLFEGLFVGVGICACMCCIMTVKRFAIIQMCGENCICTIFERWRRERSTHEDGEVKGGEGKRRRGGGRIRELGKKAKEERTV